MTLPRLPLASAQRSDPHAQRNSKKKFVGRAASTAEDNWALLRRIPLQPGNRATSESLSVMGVRPNTRGMTNLQRVHFNDNEMSSLVAPTDFEPAFLPSVDTSHWIEKLERVGWKEKYSPKTWVSVERPSIERESSCPEKAIARKLEQGPVVVNIHARLQFLFEEMFEMSLCTPQAFECNWRLCQGMAPLGAEKRIDLEINSASVEGVSEAVSPSDFTLPLLAHQRKSLAWMIHRERNQDLFVCEQRRSEPVDCNGIDLRLELQINQAFDLRGGLLCDVVGSGKTATVLALLCYDKEKHENTQDVGHGNDAKIDVGSKPESVATHADACVLGATLVFCPANVHSHWLSEAEKFCPDALRFLPLRTVSDLRSTGMSTLAAADVVVAPYELLADPAYRSLNTTFCASMASPRLPASQELRKGTDSIWPEAPNCRASRVSSRGVVDRNLESFRWHRVVLDEFHELIASQDPVRSRTIQDSIRALAAEKRWGLSGTPESFTRSLATVERAARFFRCELSAHSARAFVEHYCRKARVDIGIAIHEHQRPVFPTTAERALYLHRLRDHSIPQMLQWSDSEAKRAGIREMARLCCHFSAGNDSSITIDGLTAEEHCNEVLAMKKRALNLCMQAHIEQMKHIWSMHRRTLMHEVAEVLAEKVLQLRTVMQRAARLNTTNDRMASMLKSTEAHIALVKSTYPASLLELCHSARAILEPVPNDEAIPARDIRETPAASMRARAAQISSHARPGIPGPVQQYLAKLSECSDALQRSHESLDEARRSLTFFERTMHALEGSSSNEQCPICLDVLTLQSTYILHCGHPLCAECAPQLQTHRCPVCRFLVPTLERGAVRIQLLVEPRSQSEIGTPALQPMPPSGPRIPRARPRPKAVPLQRRDRWGSKLRHVVELLEQIRANEPDAKAIVFAQWDDLRLQLAGALSQIGVSHVVLGGDIFERSRALARFQEDRSVPLLLLSLEDSASGTNLTVASHVVLLHPMLAGSAEEAHAFEAQAVGRVRRIGQTKPVHVWRLFTRDSVEESLWGLSMQTYDTRQNGD